MLAQQQHILNRAGLPCRHNPLLQSTSIGVGNQPKIDDVARIHGRQYVPGRECGHSCFTEN
jgi:hypothetical protein